MTKANIFLEFLLQYLWMATRVWFRSGKNDGYGKENYG